MSTRLELLVPARHVLPLIRFVSDDTNTREYLTGILCEPVDDIGDPAVIMSATDGHRMLVACAHGGHAEVKRTWMFPSLAISIIRNALSQPGNRAKLGDDAKAMPLDMTQLWLAVLDEGNAVERDHPHSRRATLVYGSMAEMRGRHAWPHRWTFEVEFYPSTEAITWRPIVQRAVVPKKAACPTLSSLQLAHLCAAAREITRHSPVAPHAVKTRSHEIAPITLIPGETHEEPVRVIFPDPDFVGIVQVMRRDKSADLDVPAWVSLELSPHEPEITPEPIDGDEENIPPAEPPPSPDEPEAAQAA